MADVFRYLRGNTNPRIFAVDSAQVIEIGDAVYLNTDDVRAASQAADQGSEAANQEWFHDRFAGIAMQRSRSGDTENVRVATSGVFKMLTASATYEVGNLVGMDEAATGTALMDQTVALVATANLAIGRVSKRVATAATAVEVEIESTVQRGGPQAAA